MFKKIISLLCCVAPIGVMAADVSGDVISTGSTEWQDAWEVANSGGSLVVSQGTGIEDTEVIVDDYGINFTGNLVVGQSAGDATAGYSLYVLDNANDDRVFNITTNRDVSVGTLLQVLNSWDLEISGPVNLADVTSASVVLGGIDVAASSDLSLLNIKDVRVTGGTVIESAGSLVMDEVGAVNMAGVNAYGSIDINVLKLDQGNGQTTTGDLIVSGLGAFGGADIDVAGNMNVAGSVQNNSADTAFEISVAGNMIVNGALENSGLSMTISDAALTVNGTMKNDYASGKLTLTNLQSWQVLGGSEDGFSFINVSDFEAHVEGLTKLANGWNIADMQPNNIFSLTTGQLDLGTNQTIFNKLNSFVLKVNDGNLNLASVVNETANARLELFASDALSVGYIFDQATVSGGDLSMNISAEDVILQGQNVNGVSTALNIMPGAAAIVTAKDSLTANALITNQGVLTLNAVSIDLDNVSNSGNSAVLRVAAGLNTGDSATISAVSNDAGNMLLNAYNVVVQGYLTNKNAGVLEVDSAVASFGGIEVLGGSVGMDASVVTVQNDISISGGALNLSGADCQIAVGKGVFVDGDVVMGGVENTASGLNLLMNNTVLSVNGSSDITMNNLFALDSGFSAQFISNDIAVKQNVNIASGNTVIFGDANATATSGLAVYGQMNIADGANVEIYSNTAGASGLMNAGLITAYGTSLVSNGVDGITITGQVRFDNGKTTAPGLSLLGQSLFVIQNQEQDAPINIGSINVATGKNLYLDSVYGTVTVLGDVSVANGGNLQTFSDLDTKFAENIDNTGIINVTAGNAEFKNVVNNTNAAMNVFSESNVSATSITNSGVLKIAYVDLGSAINSLNVSGNIINNAGTMDLLTKDITAAAVSVNGGNLSLHVPNSLKVTDMIFVNGSVNQGGAAGALNLVGGSDEYGIAVYNVSTKDFSVVGNFIADADNVTYKIANDLTISGDLNVNSNAVVDFDIINQFSVNDLLNSGNTTISAEDGIIVSGLLQNTSGNLDLDSGISEISAGVVTLSGGNVLLDGVGITVDGMFKAGILGQGTDAASVVINNYNYEMNLGSLYVDAINQRDGSLTINSSDIEILGDVYATDLRFAARPKNNWMNVDIKGDVSGNVDFIGLEKMYITGNYEFNDNSSIHAIILPYATGSGSANVNYWSKVSLNNDDSFGRIMNPAGASALINVNGKFTSDLTLNSLGNINAPFLEDAQIGIDVVDIVDVDTAIWLLYAEQGVYNLDANIRNINVKFCNEDGSICVPYFNNIDPNDPDGLPAYVSVRDTDGNSIADSLYIVFDNRFGGPVQVFGVQPIVARQASHTRGQYLSAGALDNMVAGQLENKKFFNRTPIELIPTIFKDTNFSMVANELYNRMENYVVESNGAALTNFASLFENYELEQVAGILSLNEHTAFRSFEDRMVDEFIWNRNRNLKKAWLDTDYGMFYQNTLTGLHTDGNRFSIAGGFDWQESNTLMLGLTGRVSHTSSKLAKDNIDLSYANIQQIGQIDTTVSDTNVGLGGYLMKILGEKYRMYGNLMMDVHVFDIQREQTFVDTIDGSGTTFGLMAEFGLLHDILNQYIVGNLYARIGYNFGFDVTEKAAGSDYMHLKYDGYAILTPGYSLTAQKRIYPSAWFQIRPYASIGIEYDVSGMSDSADYKFATANAYSEYDLALDPLWANIGGGVELLSARGVQFGLDYRYQYNEDLQLHNIKLSGSYRF